MEPTPTPATAPPATGTLAWDEHGFSAEARECWRDAGRRDPDQAARWRRAHPDADPAELFALGRNLFRPDQVHQVARFVERNLAAWTEAFLIPRDETVDLRD